MSYCYIHWRHSHLLCKYNVSVGDNKLYTYHARLYWHLLISKSTCTAITQNASHCVHRVQVPAVFVHFGKALHNMKVHVCTIYVVMCGWIKSGATHYIKAIYSLRVLYISTSQVLYQLPVAASFLLGRRLRLSPAQCVPYPRVCRLFRVPLTHSESS